MKKDAEIDFENLKLKTDKYHGKIKKINRYLALLVRYFIPVIVIIGTFVYVFNPIQALLVYGMGFFIYLLFFVFFIDKDYKIFVYGVQIALLLLFFFIITSYKIPMNYIVIQFFNALHFFIDLLIFSLIVRDFSRIKKRDFYFNPANRLIISMDGKNAKE